MAGVRSRNAGRIPIGLLRGRWGSVAVGFGRASFYHAGRTCLPKGLPVTAKTLEFCTTRLDGRVLTVTINRP
ncbi:MAG: hypothetical protein WBN82_11280, partial [Porticoccaceae bacterium]